jgi:stage V sporulation protein D (sporulation-specific penicillin-binding protein)
MQGNYILSFIGFLPADDPELVLYVAIDNPKNTIQYGGTVSAPIAKNIFKSAVEILDIPESKDVIPKEYTWLDEKYLLVPDVIGLNVKDAKKELKSFKVNYIGDGETVINQTPHGNTMTKENGTVVLYIN